MWADNETAEDLLGFKVHADLLLDVINDDKVLPVTIGVFGDWGSGKSSILKIIHNALKGEEEGDLKDGTLVLYFNGWVFEGYDDAKAALLESIIKAFKDNEKLGATIKDEATKLIKSVKWMRLLGLGLKNVVLPSAMAYATGGLSLIPHLAKEFTSFTTEDLASKLKDGDAEEFMKSLMKEQEDETTLVREFRDDFKELIEKSKIKKLVVIIDDLDRCSPERIIENLEAIKLFLNVEKTAFLIGADPRIVRHAIEHRYRPQKDANGEINTRIVDDYLEKLIQIPYNLPKLSDTEVETYISLLISKKELSDEEFQKVYTAFQKYREENRFSVFGLGAIKGHIVAASHDSLANTLVSIPTLSPIVTQTLYGNPRQVKRFLNTYILRQRLAKVAKLHNFNQGVLAKLMVLEYSEPALFKQLYDWQLEGNNSIVELEKIISSTSSIAAVKKEFDKTEQFKNWGKERVTNWLRIEPQLSKVDLNDYFWLSRDKIASTIVGAGLIPPIVKAIYEEIIPDGITEAIRKRIIKDKLAPLPEHEQRAFLEFSSQMLVKNPSVLEGYFIFHALIDEKIVGSEHSYATAFSSLPLAETPPAVAITLKNYAAIEPIKDFIENILSKSTTPVAKAIKK